MEKPKWELETDKGRRAMAEWLDFMLDRQLDVRAEDWEAEAHSADNIEEAVTFCRDNDALEFLVDRLRSGNASPVDQKRAAILLDASPKKRGPKVKGTSARYWWLVAAAEDHERIKSLWKEHYGETYRVNDISAKFAAERWGASMDWVIKNARRPKDRKFAKA